MRRSRFRPFEGLGRVQRRTLSAAHFAAEVLHALVGVDLASVSGAVMQLQGAAHFLRRVGWAAVVGHAVPEQTAARGEGHDDVALGLDVGVADLPIASLEMIDRTFAVRAGQDVQAAVIRVGVVEVAIQTPMMVVPKG